MAPLAVVAVPILAFLGVVAPIPWHIKTKNIPTLALIFWLAQGNLFLIFTSIVWHDNVIVKYLPACNIGTAFQSASLLGISACSARTMYSLQKILSPNQSIPTMEDRQRDRLWDFIICIGLPLVFSGMQYVVTPNQLNIYEGVGCMLPVWTSWTSLLLKNGPIYIVDINSVTYGVLVIEWLWLRRSQIRDLPRGAPFMSHTQLLRLAVLACAMTVVSAAYLVFSIWQSLYYGLSSYQNWAWVHGDYGKVVQVPAILIPGPEYKSIWAIWAAQPIASAFVFLLYCTTTQALHDLQGYWKWVSDRIPHRRSSPPSKSKTLPHQTIASFASRSMNESHRSKGLGTAQEELSMDSLTSASPSGPSHPAPTSSAPPSSFFRSASKYLKTKGRPDVPVDVSMVGHESQVGTESTIGQETGFTDDFAHTQTLPLTPIVESS
ncbi:STE3-domain-containing protein [Clavulina sp. PMI_390]|nr:STE3-domain-containing protein [Clavulina sp. PMI_390]